MHDRIYDGTIKLIGRTPHARLRSPSLAGVAELVAKLDEGERYLC